MLCKFHLRLHPALCQQEANKRRVLSATYVCWTKRPNGEGGGEHYQVINCSPRHRDKPHLCDCANNEWNAAARLQVAERTSTSEAECGSVTVSRFKTDATGLKPAPQQL